MFLPTPEGVHRRVELVRQVNVLTDPLLARQALDGTLHRVGEHDLAVPFVYHDPAARRFALVVPASRAHDELVLRAELLTKLAAEATDAMPAYVREARAVVGPAGLERYLEETPRAALAVDPRVEAARAALDQREEKLHRFAQEVTRREDELVSAQNDLAEREADLDRRTAEIVAREEALAGEERLMRANMAALASREARVAMREERALEGDVRPVDDASEALTRRPPVVPDDEADDGADADADDAGRHSREVVREERMEVDFDDLAPAPPVDAPPSPPPRESPRDDLDATRVATLESVAPPAPQQGFGAPSALDLRVRSGRAYVAVVEGEVRVWFQGSPEVAGQLTASSVVPVLQADPDGPFALALLTLRGESGAPVYARVALDVARPEDRAVLESLARDFRVRAEVVSPLGRDLGGAALGAPCEQNARRVLELLTAMSPAAPDAQQAAAERLEREGLRVVDGVAEVPLHDEHALASAAAVAATLAAFEPLLDRAALDRYVVTRGVSMSQVEGFAKRLTLAALRCGVALSEPFVRRALELGVAPDEKALAARALTAYARTVEGGIASIGATASAASRAWGPLFAWAARVGVAPPEAVRAAAASLYDPDDPGSVAPPDGRAAPDPERFATMTDAELVSWVDHPDARLAAARALARRDASRHEAVIGRALRMLPGDKVAELAGELVRGGDALGDVWVELLGARRRPVAAVAAAGAGVLKLRRALTPLVQRALAKDNPDWRLAAWAAGEFGVAAVRAVARADTDQVERLAWVIGHAVRCGASREVEKARAEGTRPFLEAATRALALQDELRAWDEALRRGEGELAALVHPLVARSAGDDASARAT